MIHLIRSKESKWIMQKNVSSSEIIKATIDVLNDQNEVNHNETLNTLYEKGVYKGRNTKGVVNTMGVRFSQVCFYMFGYKINQGKTKYFIPSPMTINILNPNEKISSEENALVNLYSMQYPNPYSKTDDKFQIYIGRFLVKLLLDERIKNKLYLDEFIWFIPFINKINQDIYEDLIDSILEYRSYSFDEKKKLFENIDNYNDVFSNTAHEMIYYFLRIFERFGVFNVVEDKIHNSGKIFSFIHGNNTAIRTTAYKSRTNHSGYITLSNKVLASAQKLNQKFAFDEKPTTMKSDGIFSERDWLVAIYESEPVAYLNCISNYQANQEAMDIISNMTYMSKYGNRDGKDFENALEDFMWLFREIRDVEVLSGAGKTDLLCVVEHNLQKFFKINVDAKTRKNSLEAVNSSRIKNHIKKHGSDYCLIVAPRISKGVKGDIQNTPIVVVKAEDLGSYCYKECIASNDGKANFSILDKIIRENQGKDITDLLRKNNELTIGIQL